MDSTGSKIKWIDSTAGQQISAICEQRLTITADGATLYNSISRTVETEVLTRARLRELKKHKDMIDNHKSPQDMPESNISFNINEFLVQFPTY